MASFLWGAAGEKLTPEQIAVQRRVLASLSQRGDPAFNNAGWLGALGRGLEGAYEGWQETKLDKAQAAANATDEGLFAALGVGSAAPTTSGPVASALSSSTPASVPQTADAAALRQGLIDRGLPSHIADGFLVNFKDESGLNPGINETNPLVPGSRGGFGLYQLTGPRRVDYEAFAKSRGVDPSDTNSQLDFLGGELGLPNLGLENQPWFGSERSAANSILAAGDTASAAQAIVNNFLRPSQEYRDRRSASYANLGQGQVAQSAAPTVAATQSVAPPNGLGVSPAIIQALSSPYASERTKTVANLLLQQQQGQQKLAQAEQQRQQEIARRQAVAQQAGINPAYAVDDELWKGAASQIFQDAPTATVNGIVVNTRTGQPIFNAPQQPTSGMQDYQSYADYETQAGRTPLGPLEYEQALRRSGAPTTEGAIPTGYQANRDAQGRVVSLAPIPGGPEDKTKKESLQASQKETASDVITNSAVRAVQALNAPGLPATGLTGRIASMNPSTNAAEVRRQVAVLGANASTENINAMRAASPTGGALGAASDADLALLRAKTGALDPDSPTFERDVKDYVQALLRTVHGKDAGDAAFNAIDWSGGNQVQTDIPGVTIRRKGQ